MQMRRSNPILERLRASLGLDEPLVRGVLFLLWLTTGAFIAMHLGHKLIGAPWHPFFNLGSERGYADVFFQMLTGWSVVLLAIAAVRRRVPGLLAFAAFSTYLVADDYFGFHERVGTAFGIWFDRDVRYLHGLSTHLGEALYLLGVGIVVVAVFLLAFRAARPEGRGLMIALGVLYAALAFFGVAVDIIHAPFIDAPVIDPVLIAIEDGGEIAVMSLIAASSLSLAFGPGSGPVRSGAADAGSASSAEGGRAAPPHEAPAEAPNAQSAREVRSP